MVNDALRVGIEGIRRRPDLVLLVWGVHFVLGVGLSVPLVQSLHEVVAPTGFGSDLVEGPNVVLWADVLAGAKDALVRNGLHLLWFVPLALLWKAAAGVGLVHALRADAAQSFWQGAARFGLRSAVVGIVFAALTAFLLNVVPSLLGLIGSVRGGGKAIFWIMVVGIPLSVVVLLVGVDIMRDISRAAIVIEEASIMASLRAGVTGLFRYPVVSAAYGIWMGAGILLVMATAVLEIQMGGTGLVAVVGLFIVQQVLLLIRALFTVGWYGSLVSVGEAMWYAAPEPPAENSE